MGHKVGLSERAQNAGGQEGRSDVRQGLLHVGSKHIDHSEEGGHADVVMRLNQLLIADETLLVFV